MSELINPIDNLSKPEQFTEIASNIQKHSKKNKLISVIQGREYPMVEAWQFAGAMIGITAQVVRCENLSQGNEYKYLAEVHLFDMSGNIRGRAIATCSNKEHSKKRFDEYAICSMAQTRATGKAFRISFGWLMKAAGFEATPVEEMDQVKDSEIMKELKGLAMLALDMAEGAADVELIKNACKSITGKKWNDYCDSISTKLANIENENNNE